MKKLAVTLSMSLLCGMVLAQTDFNRTIAIVNGEEIKGPEYYRRMEHLPNVGRMIGNRFAEAPPGFLTLDQLINEKLLFQLAREKGVYPTNAEIQAEIKTALEENPKFMENWKASGGTDADLNYRVAYDLAQFKLITRGITVTDQEVEKFYKDNPTRFTIPRMVQLKVIAVDSEEAKAKVDAELKAGKAFADVAKVHSIDVSRGLGGDFGTRPLGMLPEAVQAELKNTKIGQATNWINMGTAHTKFLYERVEPEKLDPLNPTLRRTIRRMLMQDRGRAKNDLSKDMKDMRAKAKIDIKDPSFAETFKRLMGSG